MLSRATRSTARALARSVPHAPLPFVASTPSFAMASAPASPAPKSAVEPSAASETAGSRVKTAVVMLNMGGPEKVADTEGFLVNLFSDKMIINLGRFQSFGAWAGKKRAPKIAEQYAAIGGSPLRKWTALQGDAMARELDIMSPSTAPHKAYPMFRYAEPMTETALDEMVRDGATRAVAFSQYPMYSCTTSGSSITALWQALKARGEEKNFEWSVIDRWHNHPTFIQAVKRRIELGMAEFPPEVDRSKIVLLFSAHSLPMKVVEKGDSYSSEVAHTVELVTEAMGRSHTHVLAWQSKVGFLPWLVPSTAKAIEALGKDGVENVLVIPIAFTSDHVETLFEIDIEYKELAHQCGIKNFYRAPSLNDEPLLIKAQAELVAEHLASGKSYSSPQYPLKCFDCLCPEACRTVTNPVGGPENGPKSLYR